MGFLNPYFLFALLSVGLPVMLHLLNRRDPKPVPFSTLRFLQTALAKTRKSRRLTQILILSLRMLILLLVVLAFARPSVTSWGWIPEGNRVVVLVLDASASMGYRNLESTRFEDAKVWAMRLLEGVKESDRVGLVVAGQDDLTIMPPVSRESAIRKTLLDARCQVRVVNVAAALRKTLQELEVAGLEKQAEVYIFSDFQEASWPKDEWQVATNSASKMGVRLVCCEISGASTTAEANGWLKRVEASPEVLLGSGSVLVRGTVARCGEAAPGWVEVSPSGNPAEEVSSGAGVRRIALSWQNQREQSFEVLLDDLVIAPEVQTLGIRVALEPDALALDDQIELALPRKQQLKVLLVNGRDESLAFKAPTFFLQKELKPHQQTPGTESSSKMSSPL